MNIAIVANKPVREGGGFQLSLAQVLLLGSHKNEGHNFIFFTTVKDNIGIFKEHGIEAVYLRWTDFNEFLCQIKRVRLVNNILTRLKCNFPNKFDRIMKKYSIQLVYFITPSPLALITERFNYIFTAWDLCHSDSMEFPEVYSLREFERREDLYNTALRKAIKVVTLSESTKKNIIRRYGTDEKRVVCVPLLPSNFADISEPDYKLNYVDIKKKYRIGGDYIFYPAQFWPHKNHIYILQGLKILSEEYGRKISAVFTGADKGNKEFIKSKIKELGLTSQIYCIGFANDSEMPYLYRQAIALVMPTYFGPVNMPPLEAFRLGCPVLYSDLPGFNEEIDNASMPLDLKDPKDLAKKIIRILQNPEVAKNLIEKGREKLGSLKGVECWNKLKEAFDDYGIKRRCWE